MSSTSTLFLFENENVFENLTPANSNSSSLDMLGITGHLQVPSKIPTKAPRRALPRSPRSIKNHHGAQYDSAKETYFAQDFSKCREISTKLLSEPALPKEIRTEALEIFYLMQHTIKAYLTQDFPDCRDLCKTLLSELFLPNNLRIETLQILSVIVPYAEAQIHLEDAMKIVEEEYALNPSFDNLGLKMTTGQMLAKLRQDRENGEYEEEMPGGKREDGDVFSNKKKMATSSFAIKRSYPMRISSKQKIRPLAAKFPKMLHRALGFPAEGFCYRKFRTADERPVGPVPWEEEEEKKPDVLTLVHLKKEKKSSTLALASLNGKEKKKSIPPLYEDEKEEEEKPIAQAAYMKRDNSCSGSQLDLIWEEEEHWDEADRIGRAYTCDVARMA